MKPNILLFTADTLRCDKVGVYGCSKNLTPNIDAIAQNGKVFLNAYSTGPWTGPGFGSLFTSQYPSEIGYTIKKSKNKNEQGYFINKTAPFLTELLKRKKYVTACFQGNYGACSKETGFGRGFDIYEQSSSKKSLIQALLLRTYSSKLINKAKRFIKKNKNKNFFIWINLIEPHTPYIPFKYIHKTNFFSKDLFYAILKSNKIYLKPKRNPEISISDEDKQYIKYKYDLLVKTIDDYFGEIITHLTKLGLKQNTLIIFCSDHGEEFWDHGDNRFGVYDRGVDHGHTQYNELIKVPLIFYFPEHIKKGKSNILASLLDVTPTILELLGEKQNDKKLKGISLLPNLKNERKQQTKRILFSESVIYGTEKKAVFDGKQKLIHHIEEDIWEYYNLETDSAEKHPIRNKNLPIELKEALISFEKNSAKKSQENEKHASKDEELIKKRLKSLGYL